MRKITHILVHHTASDGPKTTLQAVDNYHKTRNFGTTKKPAYPQKSSLGFYTVYHYFIDWQGVVTQCHDDQDITWHGNDANPFSIGVCLAGWFDDGHDDKPSDKQVVALRTLLIRLSTNYKIPLENIVPHRKYNKTKSCYGAHLGDSWAADLLKSSATLVAPRIEKNGKAYAAYDPDTDEMLEITDGGILKALFGSYKNTPAVDVTEWSRPLSKTKKIGFIQ